jgi:hypothetical protein
MAIQAGTPQQFTDEQGPAILAMIEPDGPQTAKFWIGAGGIHGSGNPTSSNAWDGAVALAESIGAALGEMDALGHDATFAAQGLGHVANAGEIADRNYRASDAAGVTRG